MTDQQTESAIAAEGLVETVDMKRRMILGAGALFGAATTLNMPWVSRAVAKDAKDLHFGVSIPYSGLDAYQHLIAGYNGAVEELGGSITLVDANYDVKKQSDQIATLVSSKVDALIVLPTDPAGISNAIQAAVKSGTPTFCTDGYVPGATVINTSFHDGFSMGAASARYVAERLGGKGEIGTMTLPGNESWNARTVGMQFVLRQFPDIKIVADWPFDATLKTTARDAADNMLTAHPNLAAIWCAWDDAGIQSALAARAAGRDNIFTTGSDGGKQAFEYIKSGTQLAMTVAQSFYQEAYYGIFFAHEILAGRSAPRFVTNKAYAVTQESLANYEIDAVADYDRFGEAEKLGWQRVA